MYFKIPLNAQLDNCNDYETRRQIRARIKTLLSGDAKGKSHGPFDSLFFLPQKIFSKIYEILTTISSLCCLTSKLNRWRLDRAHTQRVDSLF